MARRHRQFPSSSGRLTTWIGPADQGYQTVGAGASVLISSFAVEEPLTVVRTRGVVSIAPSNFSINSVITGALGVGIVSSEALAIGITAIPGAWDDPEWGGWFVWRSFAWIFDVTTDVGRLNASVEFELDSKAMRKMDANSAIVVVVESQANAFQAFVGLRQLLKLS